jgi:trehalose 6-phosphate phosphatase
VIDALLAAVRRDPAGTLVAVDYDGTLAPIVADPAQAVPHPDAPAALSELARHGFRPAIVTGRPVTEVLRLGPGLGDVRGLVIYGHYGLEKWIDGRVTTPDEHPGVAPARTSVRALAASHEGVTVEDKGHSVAVHTRNASDASAALAEIRPAIDTIGAEHDLEVVPGRFVLELRPAGVDKGGALREVVSACGARTVVFAGDDLGDLPAIAALRELPITGFVVCSDSTETPAELRDAADLVVDGPAGVIALLHQLAASAAR